MKHKPSTYKDGWKEISYCRVCGEETSSETEECPGQPIVKEVKSLDKKLEPN